MLVPQQLIHQRYRIQRSIAQGGMGAVYEAIDERLGHQVAIKQTLVSGPMLDQAFEREARLLARLRHPALPRVTDHFLDPAGHFLVMDYIPGDDLAVILGTQQSFSVDQVVAWARQLLDALAYLHEQQPSVIHRDIKPQNLKLGNRQQLMLLDFGLAKSAEALHTRFTSGLSIPGYTLQYAPPEQIRGQGTDARSDLFSLGATLYHLLSGTSPPNALERMAELGDGQPDPLAPLHTIQPHVPLILSTVVHTALALRPMDRYASATAMSIALGKARDPIPELVSSDYVEEVTELEKRARTTKPYRLIWFMRRKGRSVWQHAGRMIFGSALLMLGLMFFFLTRHAGTGIQGQVSSVSITPAASVDTANVLTNTTQPLISNTITPTGTAASLAQMSGSINIAFAEVEPVNTERCLVKPDEAHGLSKVLFRTFSEQAQAGKEVATAIITDTQVFTDVPPTSDQQMNLADIEVWSPAQTGSVTGATPEDQRAAAERKARALNADVVFYGTIQCQATPRQIGLTPHIYISDRKLQSFEQLEFIGAHAFGSQITSPGTPSSASGRIQLAEQVVPRMNMLAQFLFGLDFYYAGMYQEAALAFNAAANIPTDDAPFFKASAILFQGTTAARMQDLQGAQVYYKNALEIDPTNVRAKYSIAEALYLVSKGDCTPSEDGSKEDIPGIQEALQQYLQIDVDGNTPYSTAMRGLLSLSTGQAYLCLTQVGELEVSRKQEYLSEAEKKLKEAIQYFDEDSPWARDHIAEANEGLGIEIVYSYYTQQPPEPHIVEANWREAGQYFCNASQLSGFAARQATFHHWIGWIHGQLDEFEQAEIERQAAITIDPQSEQPWSNNHALWRKKWDEGGTSKPPIWTCQVTDAAKP